MLSLLCIAPLAAPLAASPLVSNLDVRTLLRKEGQTIQRTIEFSSEFELIEISAAQDGEEIPSEMMPSMTRSSSETIDVEFAETVLAAEDGAAAKLSRTYDSAATHSTFDMEMEGDEMGMDPVSESDDMQSDIEGETVVVSRAEGDGWAVEPGEDCALGEEDLAGLRGDYGFGFLLPGEGVDAGDTWSIDLELLSLLLDPAGELPFEAEGGDEMMFGSGMDDSEPELEGEITATHAGSREVDGVTYEVFTLEFDCGSEMSFEPDLDALGLQDDEGEGFSPSAIEVAIEEVIDGTGEVLFDPAIGLVTSVKAALSVERTKNEQMSFEIPEMGEISMEQNEVESGEIEVSLLASLQKPADK